jgi:hypothetical protein
MRSIPVDDRKMGLSLALPPKQQKDPDKFTGEMMWEVQLLTILGERAEVLRVGVSDSGLAKGLAPGDAVQVTGLVAILWENDNGHGEFFRCESLRPASAGSSTGGSGSGKQAA